MVGLSVLLFVWALLAGQIGTFSIQQSFAPHSPMMQSLLDRYQQAYVEFQNGQIDRALAQFQLLVASRENLQGLGYDGLAAAYFEAERTDRALESLDEALERFPQHAIAHLLRGDILYTQGRTADALHEYRQAASGVAVFPLQREVAHLEIGILKTRKRIEAFEQKYDCKLDEIDIKLNPLILLSAWNGKGIRNAQAPGSRKGITQHHSHMRISAYFQQIDEIINHCPGVSLKTAIMMNVPKLKGLSEV